MKKESHVHIRNIDMYSLKSTDKKQKNKNKQTKSSFMSTPKIHYNSFHHCNNTNALMSTTIHGNTNSNTNTNTNIYNNEMNYEILLNKLLKHCKKVLNESQYCEIKQFIINEISLCKSNRFLNKNESISSILKNKSNTTSTIDRASSPCNYSSNQMHSLNYSNDFKGNHNSFKYRPKNEKQLKLSYDFTNLLTSPKSKPVKINIKNIPRKIPSPHINSTTNKINTTPIIHTKHKLPHHIITDTISSSSKAKTFINISSNNKDSHSLYTIIKYPGYSRKQITNNNINKQNVSNRSNSHSRSNTLSRECSLHNINSKTQTLNTIHHEGNISQSRNNVNKVKRTLITKSHPFLNEKLFTKINFNTYSNITRNKINKHVRIRKHNEFYGRNSLKRNNNGSNISKISRSVKRYSRNVEKEKNYNEKDKKKEVKDLYVRSSQQIGNNESKQIKENTEMMKQIKNTLDDNLKVIFNFSYEDFLSKESETESKKSSRLETLMN